MLSERDSLLPASRGRGAREGRDWGAFVATVLCAILAAIGTVPLLGVYLVKSPYVRRWAADQTAALLAAQHVKASYRVGVSLWPAAVELEAVRVDSVDGKGPAIVARRVAVRPRFFALLSGKLAIAEVTIERPDVRLIKRGSSLTNLGLELPRGSGGPLHAPFDVLSIEGANVDLDLDGVVVRGKEVDLDVTAEDDPDAGSSFELAVRAGETGVSRERAVPGAAGAGVAVDDDELCAVDGRVRIAPDGILVRRLDANGSFDFDAAPGTAPGCNLGDDDDRKLVLSLSHLRLVLPKESGDAPEVSGHVKVRAPLPAARRFADVPISEGWAEANADVRLEKGMTLPEVHGHLGVHGIHVAQFRFAKDIESDVVLIGGVVRSPETKVFIADGVATLRDVEVRPLEPGIPLKARLDVAGVSFTTLMANLGVSQRAHVAWDIRGFHAPSVFGHLLPLHIDGDFTGDTGNFAVFDRPAKDPSRERIIGVKDGQLRAHFAVRPDALEFQNVSIQMPKSKVTGGFVSIGYHGAIRIDGPDCAIDLADGTPLATIPMEGKAQVDFHVEGDLSNPHLRADASIQSFAFADMPFGNVEHAHAELTGLVLDLADVRASKNKSSYEMPSARLDFGSNAGLLMDALVRTNRLDVRDFLGVFRMDDDPRFEGLGGILSATSDLHVALGGPEDTCGGGFFLVHAKAKARDLDIYGEVFDDAGADLTYRWDDRLAGIEGADIDVSGLTLHKVAGEGAVTTLGSVIGSASIHKGALHGQMAIDALPLARIDMLGKLEENAEGALSGLMSVAGTVDAWKAEGALSTTGVRLGGASLGPSHLKMTMTEAPSAPRAARAKTKCGGTVPPDFNKEAFLRDPSSHGEITVDGDLFDGQVALKHVVMTRQKDPEVHGDVAFKRAPIGALVRVLGGGGSEGGKDTLPVLGELCGALHVERVDAKDLSHSKLSFAPGPIFMTRGDQRLALLTPKSPITVADDKLTLPEITLALASGSGVSGSATVTGQVNRLFTAPDLDFHADLAPVDLGILASIIPKVERSSGTLTGSLTVKGTGHAPDVKGAFQVRGGEIAIRSFPSAVTDLSLDIVADSSEVRIARGDARFAGGTVKLDGSLPFGKDGLGEAHLGIVAKDVHYSPEDGVNAIFDTDLLLEDNFKATGAEALPHLTGEVAITSFGYTRPVAFELGALGGKAKKADVQTYDPTRDVMKLDVGVTSKMPLRIKNNLVEAQLAIDSGSLLVSGTNQLFGLKGSLKVLPLARFHILANDFDVKSATLRFEDPTHVAASVDIVAVTEYRRYTDSTTEAAAGAGAGGGSSVASQGAGNVWRITMHAYGDADDLHVVLTSDPPLSQEDIVLLLTIGMTGAEVAQVQAGSLGTSAALEALATASGADRALKNAIPVIDDFRFGSAYSSKTGRTEPQVIVGKHLTDNVRATVATSVGEDQELRATVEWRLSQSLGVLGSYDNINDVSSSTLGNIGVDLRWHIEFE